MEQDMEFWTKLIVVNKEQSAEAVKFLKGNCTYVDNFCWIFEGDIEILQEYGVVFAVVEEGAVPSLGGLSKEELVDVCMDAYGIDVYTHDYEGSYAAWLSKISKECDCCPVCCDHPCGGVQAGGMCDQEECTCDDIDYDEYC